MLMLVASEKGGTMFMGHWPLIAGSNPGEPALEWINTIPNNGIIRYLGIFNQERIIVTTPKALNEVVTQKGYEFIKPQTLIQSLERIIGVGVLLAEGDEHRVSQPSIPYTRRGIWVLV